VTKLCPDGSALTYSSFLGGSGSERGWGIAVDDSGSAYVCGFTDSADFPITPGAYKTSREIGYVTKFSPDGSTLLYSTYEDIVFPGVIAVDSMGNAYLGGSSAVSNNAAIAALNAGGTALIYSLIVGGSANDLGWGVAVESTGTAYLVGTTYSNNLHTAGAFDTTYNGAGDGFVAKITASGQLVYATYLGGLSGDGAWDVAVDSSGYTFVSGATTSTDFPMSPFAFDTTYNGGDYDAFMAKINPAGSAVVYSTYIGGIGLEDGYGIAVDSSGSAYVTGRTNSTDFPTTPGAFKRRNRGSFDGFVSKFAEV
jgi:Tol biopolymer transport system component